MNTYLSTDAYLVASFDVLFFRKNKAFDFGEWYSEGFFPPLLSTFQGFVRTCILRQEGILTPATPVNYHQLENLVGNDDSFSMEIIGPYLFKDNLWFPIAKDIVIRKTKNENGKIKHECEQLKRSSSMIKTDIGNLFYPDESPKSKYAWWVIPAMNVHDLNAYRRSGKVDLNEQKLYETEEHFGITLDYEVNTRKTKQAREHHFYVTPFTRLAPDVRLYFQLNHNIANLNLTHQYSRLGSESRGAFIEKKITTPSSLKLEPAFYQDLAKDRKFKLILLQPGIFPENWLPFHKKAPKSTGEIILKTDKMNLKLLLVTMGQSFKVSGLSYREFATAANNTVPLKNTVNAIPAGSAFYFEIIDTKLNDNDLASHLREWDDSKIKNLPYSNMGFNHYVIGKIK